MNRPCLILISGIPASGKTTIAEKISQKFGWPAQILDRIKEIISDRITDRTNPELFDKVAKSSFDVLFYTIEMILKSGTNCIAEAFFLSSVSDLRIKELKNKCGCVLIQVHLKCDFDIAKERHIQRFKKGGRHGIHFADMSKFVDEERIKQARLNCCDYTIELDTDDFTNINYNSLYSDIKKFIS